MDYGKQNKIYIQVFDRLLILYTVHNHKLKICMLIIFVIELLINKILTGFPNVLFNIISHNVIIVTNDWLMFS